MMNRIDVIKNQPQMAFKAKPGNRKQIHEFIDKSSDLAMDFLNKERPVAEKREKLIRDTLLKLKIKFPFIGKKVKPEETTKNNRLIEMVDEAHRMAYLEKLKRTNPDMYREVLRRDAEFKVAEMTNMQIIKEFIKSFFK